MDDNFFDAQSLSLLRAFFNIRDEDTRKLLIYLAESAERGAIISDAVAGMKVEAGPPENKIVDILQTKTSSK